MASAAATKKPKKPKKEPPKAGDLAPIPTKLEPLKTFSDGVFWRSDEGGGDWVKGSKKEKKVEAVSLAVNPRPFTPAELPGFNFTSPSFLQKRTAPEKRAHGCAERRTKKGGLAFTGKRTDGMVDSFCKGNEKPCSEARKACPVQLVWVEGKPHLRFCKLVGQPGYMVPVDSPEQGYALSKKACGKWGSWPENFFQDHAPEVVEKAQKSYPKSGGLADADEPPQFGRSVVWLLGGATVAFVAAKMMKSKTT